MSNINSNIPSLSSFYQSIIFILYLCIGFIPNLEAVDKIAPQWLFMSFLNVFTGLFILRSKNIFDQIISIHFRSLVNLIYMFFILWSAVSVFYALNPTEVVVNISRQFNVFFMYSNMTILLSSIKNKTRFFPLVISAILGIEIYFVFYQAIEMLNDSGQIISANLKGVTANRNIAAFSIALKIPFLLYLVIKFEKTKQKIVGLITLTLAITAISVIQSRASYLAVGLILLGYSLIPLIFYKKEKSIFKLKMLSNIFFPLIFSIALNQIFFASKGANAIERASTISISTNDGSVNQRLRYYNHVLTHLKSNPIFGVGLGNWKFKSIEYDKNNMQGYVVPYHAHSDFIQLGAELGVLGFLSYLSIFVLVTIFSIKILLNTDFDIEKRLFIYLTLLSLGVYFIDANLNFPIARPQVLVIWTLILAIISYHFNENIKYSKTTKKFKNKLVLVILIILCLPSIIISNKVYGSLKNQMYLLRDFNTNKYNTSISQLENMDFGIPNVTVTTIPLKSLKARYYINNKQYDKALELLKGRDANPFLFFSESQKSKAFEGKGNIDSAYYYSKIAYFGLPNNPLHVANFVKLAMKKKDKKSIEQAAEQLLVSQSNINWQNIITAYIDIVGAGDKKLMELTNKAVELFPYNNNFLLLRKLAHTRPYKIQNGVKLAREAITFFNNKKYEEALSLYLKALEEDPMEYSYYENAATCYYQLKEYGNAMLYSSKVIFSFNPGTGKSEYIHGIAKIATGDLKGGCEFISKAIELDYKEAKNTSKQFCEI